MPDNQIEEPVFHLRSYGDVSASDLEYYVAKYEDGSRACPEPVEPLEAVWHWYSDNDGLWTLEGPTPSGGTADGTRVRLYEKSEVDAMIAASKASVTQSMPAGYAEMRSALLAVRTSIRFGNLSDEQRRMIDAALEATAAPASEQQPKPMTAPHPGSDQASKAIDDELEAYGWPTNTKNAARAGYEACRKLAGISIKGST